MSELCPVADRVVAAIAMIAFICGIGVGVVAMWSLRAP